MSYSRGQIKQYQKRESLVVTKKTVESYINYIHRVYYKSAVVNFPPHITEESVFNLFIKHKNVAKRDEYKLKAYIKEILPERELHFLLTKGE